ncbi:MAG: phosphoribosylformylglycinamidine synthase subunit PurL [Candidatus Thorarchaeota archaeon]|nr:MAG: phosphoribosylformylglycinamidine synthase subunit PurL [Candidatus Thorarchaeota archaeon]
MLDDREHDQLTVALGRDPTETELHIVGAMWSERRSYKSSRRWFQLFKTDGERVVLGLGGGAGLVDLGDDVILGISLESNNHPFQLNPYSGAASGVAGVISDVISHGCRPVGLMNCLRFGSPQKAKNAKNLGDAARGISDFANSVGIPMVGGELEFDQSFERNSLFNVACIGVTETDKIVRGVVSSPGDSLILFGAKTANERLVAPSKEATPTGSPLAKRVLIDTLEQLLEGRYLSGLKDLGGGGLASACAKLAAEGNLGFEILVEKVPLEEDDIQPIDILLSESQDRMLAVVTPQNLENVLGILGENNVPHAVIGEVTDDNMLTMHYYVDEIAKIPVVLLVSGFPEPERREEYLPERTASTAWLMEPKDHSKVLLSLLQSVNISSREWLYSQFDQHIQGNTLVDAGENAGVLELPKGKRVAFTAACNSTWCLLDPFIGAANSAALALRNIVSMGAEPILIADCLNLGNPERPEPYAQFVETARGIGEFSHHFDIPVVTGNVSPYNEAEVEGAVSRINPTPQIIMAGALGQGRLPLRRNLCTPWANVFLVGETHRELNGTEFQRFQLGAVEGIPPGYQPEVEKKTMNAVLSAIEKGLVRSCNNIGRGGLGVALLKMVIRGDYGFRLDISDVPGTAKTQSDILYSESSARYIVEVTETKQPEFLETMNQHAVPVCELGLTMAEPKASFGSFVIDREDAQKSYEKGLRRYMKK